MNFTYEVHLVADGKFGTQERVSHQEGQGIKDLKIFDKTVKQWKYISMVDVEWMRKIVFDNL